MSEHWDVSSADESKQVVTLGIFTTSVTLRNRTIMCAMPIVPDKDTHPREPAYLLMREKLTARQEEDAPLHDPSRASVRPACLLVELKLRFGPTHDLRRERCPPSGLSHMALTPGERVID